MDYHLIMDNYIGMNFREWCALDENDERTLHIKLYDGNKNPVKLIESFTSYDLISEAQMSAIQKSTILDIELKNNEWYIKIVVY